MRSISNLVSALFLIGLVVSASFLVSWVLVSVVTSLSSPQGTLTVAGGSAFLDPSNKKIVWCEVLLHASGTITNIISVDAEYAGTIYRTTCITCDVITNIDAKNDLIYVRFFFTSNIQPSVGDRIRVTIKYSTLGYEKYTSGYITITD